MRLRIAIAVVVGFGCGGAETKSSTSPQLVDLPRPPPIRAGVPPPSDEAGIRKLLVGVVTNGGVHFADASCRSQFGKAGSVGPDAFDAFAHCLGTLQLHPTGRPDGLDDVSVLADAAGFELEAHVQSGRLDFIGPSGRAPGMPDLPTITPEALEALRVAGDPNATLPDSEAKPIVADLSDHRLVEHERVCIGEQGEVTNIFPATAMLIDLHIAFSRIARTWKFRPFIVDGKTMPVCAIVGWQYPAAPRDAGRDLLPRPPSLSKQGHIVYMASPKRLTGSILVVPDDRDKVVVAQDMNNGPLVGMFNLCLDERAERVSQTIVKSTGLPGYDAKIEQTLRQWKFKPYVVDGAPIPVCAMFTFIYSQR